MLKTISRNVLCAAVLLLATQVRAKETVFQNGLNNYQGTQDTTLRGDFEEHKTANLWGEDTLWISGVPGGGWKMMTLIRFDDIAGTEANRIPKNAVIKSAHLELFKLSCQPKDEGQYEKSVPNDVMDAFRMKTHFTPGQANDKTNFRGSSYSYRVNDPELPQFWGDKNQLEAGPVQEVDYDPASLATVKIQSQESNQWLRWDVTAAVRDWITGTSPSEGFFLTTRGYWVGANFSSSEAENTARRPRLVVEWE
jgi:hypothetical protein